MQDIRKIKFRFWDTRTRRWCGWEISGWINISRRNDPMQVVTLHPKTNDVVTMQFTGILDTNGKEVYEGDIVRTIEGTVNELEEHLSQVRWSSEGFRCCWWLQGRSISLSIGVVDTLKLEVVGNIFENPELCKSIEDEER